jgi:hypothetical protein
VLAASNPTLQPGLDWAVLTIQTTTVVNVRDSATIKVEVQIAVNPPDHVTFDQVQQHVRNAYTNTASGFFTAPVIKKLKPRLVSVKRIG